MKLIVVTGSSHFEKDIVKLFETAGISVYSRSVVSGYKEDEDEAVLDNWFATSNIYQNSVMFFSFTDKEKATTLLKLVKEYNPSIESDSRIRAFILGVENFT